MENSEAIITDFVPRNLFDIHLQNIRDRSNSDEQLNKARFDKLEEMIKALSVAQKSFFRELKSDIKHVDDTVSEIKDNVKSNKSALSLVILSATKNDGNIKTN